MIWRGPHTVQLGIDPNHAVLVDLPDPRAARLLDLLDGSRPVAEVVTRAAGLGVPADLARSLVATLQAAGFVLDAAALLPPRLPEAARRRLTGEAVALALRDVGVHRARAGRTGPPDGALSPAQVLRRRADAKVVIAGRGRLGGVVAVALAQAGVGHVHPELAGAVTPAELAGGPLTDADVGRPRRTAVAAAVVRAAPQAQTRPIRRGAADLVIQLGHDQPAALLAAGHGRRRQAHLAVTVREGTAVVGPLVPPTGAPCLNCVDLHRRERDADWPQLAAQLTTPTAEPCAVATVLSAAGYVTAEALAYLDGGRPATLGATVEIAGPSGARRRSWPPHPACSCARPRPSGASRRTPAGP